MDVRFGFVSPGYFEALGMSAVNARVPGEADGGEGANGPPSSPTASAASNVATLQIARGFVREREMAVRLAIGEGARPASRLCGRAVTIDPAAALRS